MPVEEPKFPRIYVSLWSPTEIDWSDDEVETAVCFKRECDAITESCNGFVLYMPFDDYLSEANDLRAQLAETTGKLARLQKLWDLKCAELSIANKSINELRKADTVRPVTQSEHEKERCAFWDACCAAPYSNPCDGQWDNPQPKDEASMCAEVADAKLAERDKRFPAPESEEK
jgi:hypothetical protein